MGTSYTTADRLAAADYDLALTADVLVIGGSLSGSWAAIAAAQEGAKVIIAEKGYVGAAGPIAAGSIGAYYIKPDDPIQRDAMINARMPLAFGLADGRWGERILDQSYRNLQTMADWGYQWPTIKDGRQMRGGITPNVLIFLRQQLERLGVRILDHSPVLELLKADGVVAGAAGVNRHTGQTWSVRAGAVVVATGGTAFLSSTAGTKGNTGDGYLFSAEAGAVFSGMEFTGQFHIKPHGGTLSKGAYRGGDTNSWSTLYDNDGKQVNLGRGVVNAILNTGAAWDAFDKEDDPKVQELIFKANYVSTQFFDDAGIDPFKQKYQVDFVCEGSMRATGGLATDDDLSTTVPGLFASGDVASREKVNGAGPPGGGPAGGWALGAGFFAGQAAARFARRLGPAIHSRLAKPQGGAGLRPKQGQRADVDLKSVIDKVQEHMLALDRNYYRDGATLESSLATYGDLWKNLRDNLAAEPSDDARTSARSALRAREAASLLAAARWMNASALERKETRGLHRRTDFPALDPNQTHHLISGGVDEVWVRRKAPDPTAIYPGKPPAVPVPVPTRETAPV